MKLLKLFSRAAMLMCLMSVLGSCTDDLRPEPAEPVTGGSELPIEIRLDIPKNSDSRALTADNEKEIKELRVLIFKVSSNESFEYEARIQKFDNKKATVLLKTGEGPYRAVLIANNGRPFSTTFTQGDSKEKVLKTITFNSNEKWNTTSSNDYRPLPMSGESNEVKITGEVLANPFNPVKLTRSVSRIDVGLALSGSKFDEHSNPSETGLNGFTLESVSVYNSNQKGYVAPIGNDSKKPYVPEGTALNKKFDYDVTNNLSLREIYVSEAINEAGTKYMERPFLVIGGEYNKKTTYYRIDFVKKVSKDTYAYLHLLRNYRYKVNITKIGGKGFDSEKEAAASTAANINYDVTVWNESAITNVVYDGQYMLGVSEDNLTYYNHAHTKDIVVRTDWPAGWVAKVIKGEDWLSINKNKGETNQDVKMGITVKANKDDNAKERDGEIVITAGRMKWIVKVKQLDESELSLHIYDEDEVTPLSMLSFDQEGGETKGKKIVIKYSPSDGKFTEPKDLKVENFNFKKLHESTPGNAVYIVYPNPMTDEKNYFENRTEVATFKIDSEGKTAAGALVLQQTEYNAIPFEDQGLETMISDKNIPCYLMDGKLNKFYIKANTPYQIKWIEDEIIGDKSNKLIPTFDNKIHKEPNFNGGESSLFTPVNDINDPKQFVGYSTFEISSPTNLFKPRKFKLLLVSGIKQPKANCYMMKPGYMGILIPVTQIDKAAKYYNNLEESFGEYIGQLDNSKKKKDIGGRTWETDFKLPTLDPKATWSVEVLWAEAMDTYDNTPIVQEKANAGLLYMLKRVVGKPYIFVMPKLQTTPDPKDKDGCGNVIIALKQNNKIMWSWHLWLMKQYPSEDPLSNKGHSWLDRDLGSFGVTTGVDFNKSQMEEYGLLYQYGRKDPFPLLEPVVQKGGGGDRHTKLLDADGNDYYDNFHSETHVKPFGTMREMINNPTMYYSMPENQNKSHLLELPDGDKPYIPNKAYAALWGGIAIDDMSFDADESKIPPTVKTPFDPSPYGWKIPNTAKEADWGKYRAKISNIKSGKGFYKQNNLKLSFSQKFPKLSWGDAEVLRWTSTRLKKAVGAGFIHGQGDPMVGDYNGFSPTIGIPVRSVNNEKEQDFKNYLPNKKIIIRK